LKPEFRGHAFGPEIRVLENAPVYDRLGGLTSAAHQARLSKTPAMLALAFDVWNQP